jgi:hypothetical protein
MSSLQSYFSSLLQERGYDEFVIVRDDHVPAEITQAKRKKRARGKKQSLPDSNRPPTCPKRKDSSEKIKTIEASNKKARPSSQKISWLKDFFFFGEITPGESRSKKERRDCKTSPSKTCSPKNNRGRKFLGVAPRYPNKRRESRKDLSARARMTKKSLQDIIDDVDNDCFLAWPYNNQMYPKSDRWSARPAKAQQRFDSVLLVR